MHDRPDEKRPYYFTASDGSPARAIAGYGMSVIEMARHQGDTHQRLVVGVARASNKFVQH